jgi:antitoxin component of MazEF toxin-antitoxin module
MTPTPVTSRVRKIHRAGRSLAVVLPPVVLGHIHSDYGDYLYMDITQPDFVIMSKAPIPPDLLHPELFNQPEEQPPGDSTPPPAPPADADGSTD